MTRSDSVTSSETPAVLLLSALKSLNLGDLAMLQAARNFVTGAFSPSVEVLILGPPPTVEEPGFRRRPPFLVRWKKWLLQGITDSQSGRRFGVSADGLAGPLGWGLRGVLVSGMALALLMIWCHRKLCCPMPSAIMRVCVPLARVKAVMTTGGGWLNSNFILTLYEHLTVLLAARLVYGVPVFIVGEQVGPLQNRLDQFLVGLLLERAQLIALRDPESIAVARRLVRQPSRIQLFCDWAYLESEVQNERDSGPLRIGINLRRAHYSPFDDALLVELAAALDAVQRETGAELHFFPTCFDPHEADDSVLCELRDRCECAEAIILHTHLATPEDCISWLRRMDVNVAVSYHFCLFSLMNAVPCLGIATSDYYTAKLGGLFRLFETPDWLTSAAQIRNGEFAGTLKLSLGNVTVDRMRLREVNRGVAEQCRLARQDLWSLLVESLSSTEPSVVPDSNRSAILMRRSS